MQIFVCKIRTELAFVLQTIIICKNVFINMSNKGGKRARCLTKDKRTCLSLTCNRLVELSSHLLGTTHE